MFDVQGADKGETLVADVWVVLAVELRSRIPRIVQRVVGILGRSLGFRGNRPGIFSSCHGFDGSTGKDQLGQPKNFQVPDAPGS